MGKTLIITEKPSVAQEYAGVLGVKGRHDGYLENERYVITWCVGHLVELVYPEAYDEKYKKWNLEDYPFLPVEYKYGVKESVKNQYQVVNKMLHRNDIEITLWAGDSGKEGQTIEENIRRYSGVRKGMIEKRIWINSQTEDEILRGIHEAKPMSEYENIGNSGIMRSISDYSMGINFSRVLSVRYARMLNEAASLEKYTAISAGRVMTCVHAMVVLREREIRNFKEIPFYRVMVGICGKAIEAEWRVTEKSKYYESPKLYKENGFRVREDAEVLIQNLSGKNALIIENSGSTSKKKPPMLFNLAELQSECAKKLKLSPEATLEVVQTLYEKKMTTYPRTDARVLSTAVAKEIEVNLRGLLKCTEFQEIVEWILENGTYRNIADSSYTDDGKISDHYAIIPTGNTSKLGELNSTQKGVYDMIVKRFLSIFYPPAEYLKQKLVLRIDNEFFYFNCQLLQNAGYLEIVGENESGDKEQEIVSVLKLLKKGDAVKVDALAIKEGKTSPPKRYTTGSMVLAMENAGQLIEDEELRSQIKGSGIGTSATRAEIIGKLQRIGYVAVNEKTQILTPTHLGEMVYEVINLTIPELCSPKMTASWERGLESIVKGQVDVGEYRKKLDSYVRKKVELIVQQDLTKEIAEKIAPFIVADSNCIPGNALKDYFTLSCPVCHKYLSKMKWNFQCKCGFKIPHTYADKKLTEKMLNELLQNGITSKVVKGLKSKAGNKYEAKLEFDKETGKISPVFDK